MSLLKFVGEKFWTWPQQHISETRLRGPSVRIAPNAIPNAIKFPTEILFVHPRGTFSVTADGIGIGDLYDELLREGHMGVEGKTNVEDYIVYGLPTLLFIEVFQILDLRDKKEFQRLVDKYGVKFAPAITHYSYITHTQVVIGNNDEGMDSVVELQTRGIEVEPVKVVRVGENLVALPETEKERSLPNV